MTAASVVRMGGLVLLLSGTGCHSNRARVADAAADDGSAEPDAQPSEPPPPLRTACQWKLADTLCDAGSLCASVTAGFFDCEGNSPIAKPGVDGQLRPRLLLVGHTYRPADFGALVQFAGKAAETQEVAIPGLWDEDWRDGALVFLPGDEPALVTARQGIGLARLRSGSTQVLVPSDQNRRLVFDDVLPGPAGEFWLLFGEGGDPPDYRADYLEGRRSLLLGRFAGDRLEPPEPLFPVRPLGGGRLGPGAGGRPVVAVTLMAVTDGGVVGQSTVLARPGAPPVQLTGASDVYLDSAIDLPGSPMVVMKSTLDGRSMAHLVAADGALGAAVELVGGSSVRGQGCRQVADPSYYAADDPLRCGSSVVTTCQVVGSRVQTLPLMARGGRALFAAVVLDVDQDTVSGSQTQYQGDMPPRCGMFERVTADRSVTRVVLTELAPGPAGLTATRYAELRLPEWRRPYRLAGRSAGSGAIVTLTDADRPQVLTVLIGD